MSVYQRHRHVSEFEFFHKALEIRVEVNRLMVQESAVPKRYRLTNAVPTIETARSIVYNINRADKFYPNTTINVIERRKYLTLAMADAEQLFLDLQHAKRVGIGIKDSRLDNLLDMVEDEMRLLKSARNNVKLIGKESIEDRKAAIIQELAWLDQIQ